MCVSRVLISGLNSCFLCLITVILSLSLRAPLQMGYFLHQRTRLGTYPWSTSRPSIVGGGGVSTHKERFTNLGGSVDSNGWVCAGVRGTILTREINCANTNPKPNYQSESWVRQGLGTRSPGGIREYGLANIVTIWPLNQPLMWKLALTFSQPWVESKYWVRLRTP